MNTTNKICIYAICKNESQFVDKWLTSMSEADYIVVLDTGSTDGTYEMLASDPRVHRVEQKEITPWRFDTARNESMKLIPEDANILMCTDLDEVLEPGWADIIRENWDPSVHIRGYYKYAWSHTPEGDPARVFYYDKLHNRNWYWKAPVHEFLTTDYHKEIEDNPNHILDLFNSGVYLHHYPDSSKSRGSYLGLLKVRAEEDPTDYYGKYYLSHEYHYRGYYNESNAVLEDIVTNYKDKYTVQELAACYLFMGDNYRNLGNWSDAIKSYQIAIDIDPSYREPYLLAAEVLNERKQFDLAIGYVKAALKNSRRHYTWIERDKSWNEQPDDILSIAYFYTGRLDDARRCVLSAHSLSPSDERISNNVAVITATQ